KFMIQPIQRKTHFYSFVDGTKSIRGCTACTKLLLPKGKPRYNTQDEIKCQCNAASNFHWNTNISQEENLVPIKTLNVNPSDWFEHVQWIDQLAITRQQCICFLKDMELPEWVLFEAALE